MQFFVQPADDLSLKENSRSFKLFSLIIRDFVSQRRKSVSSYNLVLMIFKKLVQSCLHVSFIDDDANDV